MLNEPVPEPELDSNGRRWWGFHVAEAVLRRAGFTDYTLFLLLAGVCGLTTGLGVTAFRASYESITQFAIGGGHEVLDALEHQPWWRILLVPVAGGALVALLIRVLPHAVSGEHGVARVIYAVARREGHIPFVSTVRSFLTNAISIGVGGSVGPEGPVIELGSGLGSGFAQRLKLSPERVRTLVGCGAAAGLAAAFNAPIAGTIFALEIVLRDFAVVTFSPIIISAVLATAVSRAVLGDAPAFAAPGYELHSPLELIAYLGLGATAGAVGVFFTWLNHNTERFGHRLSVAPEVRAAGAGLILGAMFLLGLPHLYGVGYEPVTALLSGELGWQLMLLLVITKMVATAITYGGGFTGGIFAPTLLVGGALGGLFGQLAGRIWPTHAAPMGAYSLVGMAALMAAVTHAPITSILILFELTGGYEIILPLMTACIASVAVAQRLSPASMFTLGFVQRGIDLNYGRESAILRDFYAEDLMHPTVPTLELNASLEEMVRTFLAQSENTYYVVDGDRMLRGVIDVHQIKELVNEQGLSGVIIAADLMQAVEQRVQRRENLEDTIMILSSADVDELPVVTNNETPFLEGTISRRDILELYNREILHKEILGIKLVHRDTKGTDFVDLPSQYQVDLISVDPSMAGKTLADLSLREHFGVHVLAIKRPGSRAGGHNELPNPSIALTARDRLIVVGRREDVERLKEGGG